MQGITVNSIIKQARNMVGIPFHLQGRSADSGVDCIGLIMVIADNLNIKSKQGELLSNYDINNYSINRNQQFLVIALDQHLAAIKKLEVGCIALFNHQENLYHLGIVGDYSPKQFSIIHACMKQNKVIEHRLTTELIKRVFKLYKFQGI